MLLAPPSLCEWTLGMQISSWCPRIPPYLPAVDIVQGPCGPHSPWACNVKSGENSLNNPKDLILRWHSTRAQNRALVHNSLSGILWGPTLRKILWDGGKKTTDKKPFSLKWALMVLTTWISSVAYFYKSGDVFQICEAMLKIDLERKKKVLMDALNAFRASTAESTEEVIY